MSVPTVLITGATSGFGAAAARRFRRLDTRDAGVLILAGLPVTQAQLQAQQMAEERAKRGPPPQN